MGADLMASVVLTSVLASGSSDSSTNFAFALFAAGPAAGGAVWFWVQKKYRNRGARYMPERVVHHEVHNLTAEDTYLKRIQSRSRAIIGRNDTLPHVRAKFSQATLVPPPAPEKAADAEGDAVDEVLPDGVAADGAHSGETLPPQKS